MDGRKGQSDMGEEGNTARGRRCLREVEGEKDVGKELLGAGEME